MQRPRTRAFRAAACPTYPRSTLAGYNPPMRALRLLKILWVIYRFGLDEFLLGHERVRGLLIISRALFFWRNLSEPRAVRLRRALEKLGPIFVKFG